MKIGKLKVGQQVVLNDLDDAQVYDVLSIEKNVIEIAYKLLANQYVASNYIDCSLLQYPNKNQLSNNNLTY